MYNLHIFTNDVRSDFMVIKLYLMPQSKKRLYQEIRRLKKKNFNLRKQYISEHNEKKSLQKLINEFQFKQGSLNASINNDTRNQVLYLRSEGLTYREISEATGISKSSVGNIINTPNQSSNSVLNNPSKNNKYK